MAAAFALAAALVGACAGPHAVLEGGRYRVPGHASSIAAPGEGGSGWVSLRVDGAALAFRGESGTATAGASMSLLERCAAAAGRPRVVARQLLIGLTEREFGEDRAVEVAGRAGWLQALDASDGEERVHLRTVTRVEDACSLDFVLVAPPGRPDLDGVFDAWWQSWRPDPGAEAPRAGGAGS